MSSIEPELTALVRQAPLSSGWQAPEPFEQVVQIAGIDFHLVGLVAAREGGGDVAGSAAGVGGFPVARAYFELLERSAVIDAISRPAETYTLLNAQEAKIGECTRAIVFPDAGSTDFSYSKSNGVAAGRDWASACHSAHAELYERHSVLNTWFGFAMPSKPAPPVDATLKALKDLYDVETYRFPSPAEHSLDVRGVFAFPKIAEAPLVYGFAADTTAARALERAGNECLQRLAFLWGEEIPSEEPPFSAGVDYHQELYLWPPMHERLRSWLLGEHVGRARLSPEGLALLPDDAPKAGFIDLTPPHLVAAGKELRVVKAISSSAAPLTFGRGHPWFESTDPALATHPIA